MNLNVGCGTDVRKGWVNLDSHNLNGADVVFDLQDVINDYAELPFSDDTFDTVLCSHVLEDFVNPLPLMNELVRVSKRFIVIKVPCDTALNEGNMRHIYPFSIGKLLSYASDNSHYGIKSKIGVYEYWYYGTKGFLYSYLCAFVKNLVGYKIAEATFVKYLFPSGNIYILYEKLGVDD